MFKLFRTAQPSIAASKLADLEKCETLVVLKVRHGAKSTPFLAKKSRIGNKHHRDHHNKVMTLRSAQASSSPSLPPVIMVIGACVAIAGILLLVGL